MNTILNSALNHRIEHTDTGYALYAGCGYMGTYATLELAMRAYRAPQTNYDNASNPDGI